MAIFFLQISSLNRAAGRRATAAAAYRAGARIRDERSGELINYSRRADVLHSEILLPDTAGQAEWARDRSRLWNAAEAAEKRRNSVVAREFLVALPTELDPAARTALARSFAGELAQRYGIAVDLSVHAPREAGDVRNHHAHLLATTREVTAQGLGAKAGLDRYAAQDWATSIEGRRAEFRALRARWAELTNTALAAANVAARVDHRSLEEQGIAREPEPRLPMIAVQMERRGQPSAAAERLREAWRTRVQAHEVARAQEQQPQHAPAASLEDVRREAREAWLRLRAGTRAAPPEVKRALQAAEARSADPDDDLSR